tara:strand:- start:268 stop:444 length:177 start_codon:yes stop_codon:yes gene_type:complete
MRNLGSAFANSVDAAGISTAEALRELGSNAAYRHSLHAGNRPHVIGCYVLQMALQGRT